MEVILEPIDTARADTSAELEQSTEADEQPSAMSSRAVGAVLPPSQTQDAARSEPDAQTPS